MRSSICWLRGWGGSSADSEQSENLNNDTGSYDPNEEGRGTSGKTVNLSTIRQDYTAQNGETLTGTLAENVKISIADGAAITLRDATINGINWAICPWAGLTCVGDAALILEGTNSVKGFHHHYPGIHIPEGKTLTIKGSGSLSASSHGYAAGIGSGRADKSGGNIVIEGGTITATGGQRAAGIGSSLGGSCGNITITGGIVSAAGGIEAPAIGSGKEGRCGNITITKTIEEISATKGADSPNSIGAGLYGKCGTVTVYDKTGAISESPYTRRPHTDLSTLTANYIVHDNETLTGTLAQNVKVSIADGATVTLRDALINGKSVYACKWAGLTCEGDAVIILEGTNAVKGFWDDYPGIYVPENKTLTIEGNGSLAASSNGWGAGIGGAEYRNCGNIVINGGTITAEGGTLAAGIGGSTSRNCGNITINSGDVTATGGADASGIGTGGRGRCGEITITGGSVAAKGNERSAGIGSASSGTCRAITISGGNVTAEGGRFGAGIGTGEEAYCGAVTINGGSVSATGGEYAAGIGGGTHSTCDSITITDTVTRVIAVPGSYAEYSIGEGSYYFGERCRVTIGGVDGTVSDNPFIYPR